MTIALTNFSETIRFYSGYDYAKKVRQLFDKIQQAPGWFENPPEKIGKTAYLIEQELLPSDEVDYLNLNTTNAKHQMDTATAKLSYVACLVCQCVQTLVFHFMNIRMLNHTIGSLSRMLRNQKAQFIDSAGFKIGDKEIGDEKYDLFVLTLSESTEVKITLKSSAQSALLIVDFENPECIQIKQIRCNQNPLLQQALGQIANELIARQETAIWIFSKTAEAILKSAGFHPLPNTEGLWKRRVPNLPQASPILPGKGPFLPVKRSANT